MVVLIKDYWLRCGAERSEPPQMAQIRIELRDGSRSARQVAAERDEEMQRAAIARASTRML
jgi:hypothetical protein